MKKIKGDLLKLAESGEFDVIVHGCNCFHTMGAGVARQLADKWPEVLEVDKETSHGNRDKLGSISIAKLQLYSLHVVNAYTQYDYGYTDRSVDYEAVAKCFSKIAYRYSQTGFKIGYPMIGAGLAGGRWSIIEPIIDYELRNCNHTLVEYDPTA